MDDITPANIEAGDIFTVSGVATDPVSVTSSNTSASTLVDALVTAINDASGKTVTASNVSNKLRLTANVAGTAFTATPSTTNRAAVAQVNTITIGGTIEAGDIFTASLPGSVTATYTAVADDTTNLVAAGLNSAIQASSGYDSQAFTSGVATNVVTLTAKVAGTGFTVTSSATNKPAVAQVVTFTPDSPTAGKTFRATINGGSNLDYTVVGVKTVQDVVEGLVTAMDGEAGVSCTEDDTRITCTADVAGTQFTFTATVVDITAPTVTSITPSLTTITEADVGTDKFTITINYSEAMDQTSTPQIPETPELEVNPQTLQGYDATSGWTDADTYVRHYNVIDNNVTETGVDIGVTTAKDLAGNTQTAGNSADAFNVDTSAPSISSVAFSPASGTRKIGDTITLTINADAAGYTAGATTVNGVAVSGFTDASGGVYTATYTVASGNTDRADTDQIPVSIVLTDAAGNSNAAFTTSPSADNSPSIDANVPAAPSTPNLNATSDNGSSDSDDVTNATTPTFTLSAESGSSIKIYDTDGTTVVGLGDPTDGTYVIGVSSLSAGTHSITAKATDAAGNVSAASGALSIMIDAGTPTITSITSDATASGTLKIGDTILFTLTPGATEAGATVSGSYNGVSLNWSTGDDGATYTATYTVASGDTDRTSALQISSVTITDVAGNTSTPTSGSDVAKEIDANAPTLVSAQTKTTTRIDTTWSETIDGNTINSSGTEFSVSGFAVSAADDNSDNIVELTVATMPTDATPAVTFTNSGTFRDLAGNEAVTPTTVTPTDGIVPTLSSVAIASDNASTTLAKVGDTVTVSFTSSETIQTPTATIVGQTATISGSGPYTATYVMQEGDAEGTVSFSIDFSDLADNAGVAVTATGDASNVTFDKTAPSAPSTPDLDGGSDSDSGASGTDDITRVTTPVFVGTAEANSTVEIYDGGGSAVVGTGSADGSGNWTITTSELLDGIHSIYARATDAAGNESSASDALSVTIDTEAPTIDPVPDITEEATSATGATVTITPPTSHDTTDGDIPAACDAPTGEFALGGTLVTCTASDMAGNPAVSTTFTVTVEDTTAPTISLNGPTPDVEINTSYEEFGATASDAVDGDLLAIPSGSVNTSVVGSYDITYNKTDDAGNIAEPVVRTVSVIDSIANTFDDISDTLAAQDIESNLSDVTTNNVSSFPDLYLEKSILDEFSEDGVPTPIGKLTFTSSLDLSDPATQSFLQELGSKLEQSEESIAFDARTSEIFSATGAVLTMYSVTPGVTESQLVVRDDDSAVLDPSGIVSGFTQDPETGDVTFTAAHFTQFDIDTTEPTFGPMPPPSSLLDPRDTIITTGEAAVIRVTAIDDIAVDKAQISINGEEYVDMDFVSSIGETRKRYTYNIAVPSDSTAEITYQVMILDVAGNSATSEVQTITVTDNDIPTISGIENDSTLTRSKTWEWSATDNVSSTLTFRYAIDQDAEGVPTGEYTDTTTATQDTGDGTHYLHVQAQDEAGNESEVTTVSVDLDNTALSPEELTAGSETTSSLALSWTNSELNGSYYTIKRSVSEITEENFDSATTLGGAPTVASGVQGYVAKNLSANTTYYFAMKMTDELGNVSEISTANGTTAATGAASTDVTAPAAVTDLSLSAGGTPTSQITLSWSATGDDDDTGIASSYIVKRSTSAITADTFDAATTVFNSLAPKGSGSAENLTVSGLLSGTQYCFALKVQDEAPNASSISNSECLTTSANLPTVTSVSPTTGQNDDEVEVMVTGTNFAEGTNTIRFVSGDNMFDIAGEYESETELMAAIPVGAPVGEYGVRVIDDNGTSEVLTSAYTVTAAPTPLPAVTDIVPSTIGTNDSDVDVEIYGTDFTGATGAVLDVGRGTVLTNFTVVSATKITATIPDTLSAGTYNVKITTAAGTNAVSAVQIAVSAPVVINSTTSQDQVTDDPIDLGDTNIIPVQITLQSNTDNSTLDNNTTIEVIISPETTLTNADGSAYTGNINPPQLVKPTAEIEATAGSDAVVITMGNPNERINFSNDFVTTVTLETTNNTAPLIWYYNPSSGLEIAGKDGTKDNVTYAKGGTLLNTVVNGSTYIYTIGLLLDHMSSYVAGVTPTISGISPTSGRAESTATITGTNFSPGATVKFGATAATATINSVTQITVTVPSIATGAYTITVINTDNLSATTNFTVLSRGGGAISIPATSSTGSAGSAVSTVFPVSQATPVTPATPAQGQVLGAVAYNFTKSLAVGSRGADVTALQQFFIDTGYSVPSGATGYFGRETRAAVMAFQKARGIAQVGNVGPLTRAALNKGVIATAETISQASPGSNQTASVGSALSTSQINAIVGLLQAFGADIAIITKVRAALGR